MSQALITELERENLSTHFVLPLLKLNKFSFLSSNFVDCYLVQGHLQLLVEVADVQLLSRKLFLDPNYRGLRQDPQTRAVYMLFQIPPKWRRDVETFCKGQFSLLSKAAKEQIYRYSGLTYKEKEHGSTTIITDGRLLALEKHEKLKKMWEVLIQPTEGHIPEELLSIPGEEAYKDIERLVHIKKAST